MLKSLNLSLAPGYANRQLVTISLSPGHKTSKQMFDSRNVEVLDLILFLLVLVWLGPNLFLNRKYRF